MTPAKGSTPSTTLVAAVNGGARRAGAGDLNGWRWSVREMLQPPAPRRQRHRDGRPPQQRRLGLGPRVM